MPPAPDCANDLPHSKRSAVAIGGRKPVVDHEHVSKTRAASEKWAIGPSETGKPPELAQRSDGAKSEPKRSPLRTSLWCDQAQQRTDAMNQGHQA